jgi:hypothetical protein
LMLGTVLVLFSASPWGYTPWAYGGEYAAIFGVSTVLWLTRTQLVASGIGGILYRLAGSNVGCGDIRMRSTSRPTQRSLNGA